MMGRKTQLHIAGEFGNGIDGLVLINAERGDGLRRVEQLGEFVEVGHDRMEGEIGATAHARPREEVC